MDILIEILLDVYMELMMLVVPEKNITKKHKVIAYVIAFAVLFGVGALIIWGVSLIVDQNRLIGILPISVAAVISLAQIIAGIVLFKKNHTNQ